MSDKYTAPDLATTLQWARETGAQRWEAYRLKKQGTLPHVMIGEQSFRVLMPAWRKIVRGEQVDPSVFKGRPITTRAA